MLTILKDKTLERWDLIPDSLREAIASEENSEFVWKTCENEHIPAEKITVVARVTGYVFLGFLHPEDLAQEIKDQLGIDIKTANSIEETLNKRIFAPVRSDIDKAYSPLSKIELPPLASGPKILQGVDSAPANIAPIKPAPLPVNKMAAPAMSAQPATMPAASVRPAQAVPPPQKPATTSDIGWSKTQSSGPVIKLDTSNVPPTPPTAKPMSAQPTSRPQDAATGAPRPPAFITPGPMSEFDRLNIKGRSPLTGPQPAGTVSAPTATTSPASSSAAGDPPPVMLHEDSSFKAAEKNAGFTLAKPGSGAEVKLNPSGSQSGNRAAVLELGGSNPSAAKPPAGSSGAVHYTEFKPSLSSVPTADSGPRNVSQITPPTLKPLTPLAPMPPAPATPMPPTPPRGQATPSGSVPIPRPPQPPREPGQTAPAPAQPPAPGEKVIVKDFL